jgi:hypothetical protein
MSRRIHLTIDRLVLRGIGPEHREALVQGLERGLESLLLDTAITGSLRESHIRSVLGGGLSASVNAGSDLGREAAERVGQIIGGMR